MRSSGQQHDSVLAPGVTFEGRYEIIGQLGEGGFGTVYEARQLSTGQPVALKILRVPNEGGAQTGTRIARFLRETRLCARLCHPNLVQLVDSGKIADGTPYIAFTFVPGQNLAALLATEGALAPREARHLMRQVLDALVCAHAQGVVHRDLKPSNIMVIPTGARRNALVLDFGIGALLDDNHATRLTGSRDALGTPGYGAPEQWRGGEPSPRGDLFSWGLVFLECLTGTPVYTGAAGEIFYRLLGPDSVPMPPALERHPLGVMIARALRKDVAARDVTARGLFDALGACDLRGLSRGGLRAGGEVPAHEILGSAPTINAPIAVLEGERRQVTALSCVLGGSGPRAAGARADDAEDTRLRAGLVLSADIARRHGGHVAAMLGDELLVYFGYPRAEEDDARRAARAALEIVSAIEAKGDGLRAQTSVHAGLVVTHNDDDVVLATGCTSRLASRLARSAPPGAVLVTADAHKVLRKWFACEAEGVQSIEEVGSPLKVFRLTGSDRVTEPTPEASQAPLVGRDQELELLMDRWRRACAGGGQSTLVTGEPGIGKSRLSRELRARLGNEAHTFVDGRCAPDTQNNALFPIVDLLGRALGIDLESSPAGKVARLESELARHGLAPAEAMPLFLPLFSLPFDGAWKLLDVSPQKHKELTLNGVVALLFALAEERPVLLVVEDLHWADPMTLELLGQIVREAPSAPMCVLMTARPEFSPAFPTTGVLQLHLNRLERAQIEVMVGVLTRKKALPAGVLEQVARRTDGVPFFVEELTRMMVDSGALVEREDRYELKGSLSDVEIPSTLRGLLTARLDRLGRTKETAQLAAALGREFNVELLAAVSALGASGVQEDLERLMGAGLVLRKRRAKDPVAVFKHALVRDAAYESLAEGARQKVHARIAATLEERFGGLVEGRPELLAYHHAAAAQKRVAIGYAQKAARGALLRSAYFEVVAHARQALGWLDAISDERERTDLELALNGTLFPALIHSRSWAAEEIRAVAERSEALLDTAGDSPHMFPILRALQTHHHTRNEPDKACELSMRLVALAERLNDVEQQITTRPALGSYQYGISEFAAARENLERTIALYDPVRHRRHAQLYGLDTRAMAQSTLGLVLWSMGHPDSAIAHARAALAWARELNDPGSIGLASIYASIVHQYRGEPAQVIEICDAALDMASRMSMPVPAAYCGIMRAWATRDLPRLREAVTVPEQMGLTLALSYYSSLIVELEISEGQHDAALARIAAASERAERSRETYFLPELLRLKGICLLAHPGGQSITPEECFRQAMAGARAIRTPALELRAAISLGQWLDAQGRRAEARELLAEVYGQFDEGGESRDHAVARSLLEELGMKVANKIPSKAWSDVASREALG